jgi:predicted CopG family antitoxin
VDNYYQKQLLRGEEVMLNFWNALEEIECCEILKGERTRRMGTVEDYVISIEGTCGQEKTVIVTFKYGGREDVLAKILKKAKLKNSFSGVIHELVYRGYSFRVFSTGKAIFSGIPSKEELHEILTELLL